jgi:Domain of unknown function (DUF4440)
MSPQGSPSRRSFTLTAAAALASGCAGPTLLQQEREHMLAPTLLALPSLQALNAKFIHNFVTNDVASHDAILHERFTSILPNGARLSRKGYLKAWSTGFDPEVIVYWDYRDERIDVFGDVALVSSTNKWIRRRDGIEVTGMTKYTDTYLYENSVWKCILAQLTNVTQEHFPPDETIVKVYVRGKVVSR